MSKAGQPRALSSETALTCSVTDVIECVLDAFCSSRIACGCDINNLMHFIEQIIEGDIEKGKNGGKVATRFPPEPNGYLHIGHAKSLCLNFGMAKKYAGTCNLRFDDTNPEKESDEYVNAIKDVISWLEFKWQEPVRYASDYFGELYDCAVKLIKEGKAYICSLSPEETKKLRGTLTEPGKNSPHRDRSVEENLDLFAKMKAGEFEDGAHVLRAKIDMASGNMKMRDPVLYRIRKVHHHRTGNDWCIYPMYDFTHCLSDSFEGITHSLCTLEFEEHRPLYDWILKELKVPCHPQQIEFARLNLNYTVMSKRLFVDLVEKKKVSGWDDPRMPTLAGFRRRGYTPASIRDFCDRVGVTKKNSVTEVSLLENSIREDLDKHAPRRLVVLKPLKVVIENYPEGKTEDLEGANHPKEESFGTRKVPFSKEIFIEKDDFMEDPPKKFFRLGPGREVRLRFAYFIKCEKVIKNDAGEVVELRCSYDPESKGGKSPDGRKVKGTIHWVSAAESLTAEVRLYDRLFSDEFPKPDSKLNPDSLEVVTDARLEPSLKGEKPESRFQFERLGFFSVDIDSTNEKPVFNRTVTLRDTWAKIKT